MTRTAHDQARELIAMGEGLSHAQEAWLRAHLQECAPCRHYAEAANQLVRSLRALPLAADARLVRATQMRVRFHAERLREARQRMWLVAIACLGVGLSAAVTAPLLWTLFAWIGQWAGVSTLTWQIGFLFFFFVPALIMSVFLLARGTYWTGNGERSPHKQRQG